MKKKAFLFTVMSLLILSLCAPAATYAKGSDKADTSEVKEVSETSDEKDKAETTGAKDDAKVSGANNNAKASDEKDEAETTGTKDGSEAADEKNEAEASGAEEEAETSDVKDEPEAADIKDEAETSYATGEVQVSDIKFEETEGSDGGDFRISWEISGISEEVYIRINLVTDSASVSGIELAGMKSGTSGYRNVSIPAGVASGYYKFMISATTMGGLYIAQCDDEAFFYNAPDGQKELEGVVAGRSAETAYAIWDDECPASLYMYDAATLDLIGQITTADKPAQLDIPEGYTDIVIGIASAGGETAGRFVPCELPLAGLDVMADPINVNDITNEREISVTPNAVDGTFRLFKNHKECIPSGNTYTVSLDEGMNELLAFTENEDGYTTVTRKLIELDTIPPVISLQGTGNVIQTDQPYVYIQGTADQDALVTCDNAAVGMVGNCFSIKKDAAYGTNTIKLRASDKAGNTTICNIEVTRSFWSGSNGWLIPIAAALIFGIAAEIYLLFFRQKKEKKDEKIY